MGIRSIILTVKCNGIQKATTIVIIIDDHDDEIRKDLDTNQVNSLESIRQEYN